MTAPENTEIVGTVSAYELGGGTKSLVTYIPILPNRAVHQ